MTEDEMVGWYYQHDFEQALGVGDGQRSQPQGHKELDTSEQLN